jgi:hypothetical protein
MTIFCDLPFDIDSFHPVKFEYYTFLNETNVLLLLGWIGWEMMGIESFKSTTVGLLIY